MTLLAGLLGGSISGWDRGGWDEGTWDGGLPLIITLADSATAAEQHTVLPSVHITDAVPLIDQVAVGGSLSIIIGIDLADAVTATDHTDASGRQITGGTSRVDPTIYASTAVTTARATVTAAPATRGKQAVKKLVAGTIGDR